MAKLVLYEEYSREEAHGIFSPDSNFTPQAGTWGIQGVVPIPDRPGDYVFFVTFGQTQGEHTFDEGITQDGVLSWQSQPQQTLIDRRVQQWIHHDEFVNNIYLFLRTSEERKRYAYLGRLKYLDHDRERERPVYFQWQVLDWSLTADKQSSLGLLLQKQKPGTADVSTLAPLPPIPDRLIEVQPPPKHKASGQTTPQFRAIKSPDYSAKDAMDRTLGRAGELAVVAKERNDLLSKGRADLADKVSHVSEIEGDGAGYDIKSFTLDGLVRYIEVKTSKGDISTPFFMSINEIRFSELHAEHYVLYRVFEFQIETGLGKMFKIEGNIKDALQFEPIAFRVRI
jgi:hypothetical protein